MVWHALTVVLAAVTPAPAGSIAIDGGNVSNWLRTLAGTMFLAIIPPNQPNRGSTDLPNRAIECIT